MKRIITTLLIAAAVLAPAAQARHGTPAEEGTHQPPTRVITVTAPDTFHWSDAGIGVGGTLGVLLAALGTGLLLQRHRDQTRAA